MKKIIVSVFSILIFSNIITAQDIINETGKDGKFVIRDSEKKETLIVDDGDVSIVGTLKIENMLEGSESDGIVVWDSESKSLKVVPRVFDHRSPLSKPLNNGAANLSVMDPVLPGDQDDPNDQVILDDLIVDGSACVGLDCVNGESFGFDTIRLKENNLRIKFVDTSTSASFPSNDWTLEANASSNGGNNYFAIVDVDGGKTPFRVFAGARNHALVVDAQGDVGIGTNTPALDIDVMTGNTPSLRLQQDGSSGFTAQSWDVAGNEAGFFIRDATNGSTLPFRIRPGAPSSSIDIAANGYVGIGNSSPGFPLDVKPSSSGAAILLREPNSTDYAINLKSLTNRGEMLLFYDGVLSAKFTGGTGDNYIEGKFGINTSTPAGELDVNGAIFQRGASLHADYVFEDDYELESIVEHSNFMWTNKHLPAIPKAMKDANGNEIVEVGSHRKGIVEELEKAHIYISQLHSQIANMNDRMKQLESILVDDE